MENDPNAIGLAASVGLTGQVNLNSYPTAVGKRRLLSLMVS
jgi:hypothetical protein